MFNKKYFIIKLALIPSMRLFESAKMVKMHWRDKSTCFFLFGAFCFIFAGERHLPQHFSLMIVTISVERFQSNPKCGTLNCNNDTQRSMELVNDLKYYALNAPILANSRESVDSTCPDQSRSCQCHSRRERYPPFPLLSPLPFFKQSMTSEEQCVDCSTARIRIMETLAPR